MISIKLRADGSANLGLGHLVRSKALADMLSGMFDVQFYCTVIPKSLMEEFKQSGIKVTIIEDEREYFDSLSKGEIAVIDGYNFHFNYQKMVIETGARLVCIDDLAEGEFVADLIINQSAGVQKSDYRALFDTQFALGPDYALLRPSFFKDDIEFCESNLRKNLLICFGGSDVQNITEKALKIALDFKEFDKITIITGSAYRYENSLFDTIEKCGICEYYHSMAEQKMAELMFKADAAIVPASGILFEALATKNVVISGMYIENQKRNYAAFRDQKAFIDAGRFGEREIESALRQVQTFSPIDLVDGKSPKRIKSLFEKISL